MDINAASFGYNLNKAYMRVHRSFDYLLTKIQLPLIFIRYDVYNVIDVHIIVFYVINEGNNVNCLLLDFKCTKKTPY
jgi:hypothetical protein